MRDIVTETVDAQLRIHRMRIWANIVLRILLLVGVMGWISMQDWSHGIKGVLVILWEGTP